MVLLSETAFKNDFGPQEVPKQEKPALSLSDWALPEVQNQFWKQFRSKVVNNYYSKFFFGASRSKPDTLHFNFHAFLFILVIPCPKLSKKKFRTVII